jgi:hypothetical protein
MYKYVWAILLYIIHVYTRNVHTEDGYVHVHFWRAPLCTPFQTTTKRVFRRWRKKPLSNRVDWIPPVLPVWRHPGVLFFYLFFFLGSSFSSLVHAVHGGTQNSNVLTHSVSLFWSLSHVSLFPIVYTSFARHGVQRRFGHIGGTRTSSYTNVYDARVTDDMDQISCEIITSSAAGSRSKPFNAVSRTVQQHNSSTRWRNVFRVVEPVCYDNGPQSRLIMARTSWR